MGEVGLAASPGSSTLRKNHFALRSGQRPPGCDLTLQHAWRDHRCRDRVAAAQHRKAFGPAGDRGFAGHGTRASGPASFKRLTKHKRKVISLAAAGLSNDEIGDRVVVIPATAKTHVSRVMVKRGAAAARLS